MPRLTRFQALLAKVETTYGVDALPTAADGMLVKDLELSAMEVKQLERGLARPFLGGDGKLLVGAHVKAKFKVEAAGSGTAGTSPKYGRLLRACGLAEVLVTGLSTIATNADPIGAVVGSFTYAKTMGYSGNLARTVTLTCTTAGASGVAEFTVAAPAAGIAPAYNQTGVVMTTGQAFDLGQGAVITPSVTADFALGDKFAIDLKSTRVEYRPISQGQESLTMYVNQGGTLHAILGARGTVSLKLTAQELPYFDFEFTGLFVLPTDQPAPQSDTSEFLMPLPAEADKTPIAEVHGVATPTETVTLDLANKVEYRELIGGGAAKGIVIVDRMPTGSITFEDPGTVTKNLFGTARSAIVGSFRFVHGIEAGKTIEALAPYAQLGAPKYSDSQGVQMLGSELSINRKEGDDELVFAIH